MDKIPTNPITGSTFKVVFKSGKHQYFDDIGAAAKAYWNEVWNVDGPYIPELYKCSRSGVATHRLVSAWHSI